MLDLTKPVQTRDGRQVRILCTDIKGRADGYTIAYLADFGYGETVVFVTKGGFHNGNVPGISSYDLVNVKTKHKRWMNIYKAGDGQPTYYVGGGLHTSLEKAKENAGGIGRIYVTTIPVEWEE